MSTALTKTIIIKAKICKSRSILWFLQGQQFDVRLENINAKRTFLLPTIEFTFVCSTKAKKHEKVEENLVTDFDMKVSIKNERGDYTTIGFARPQSLSQTWKIDEEHRLIFSLTLDHFTLFELEKVRRGGDLNLNFSITFKAFVIGKTLLQSPSDWQHPSISFDDNIAKSTWVEGILPSLGHKNVALIEAPVLDYPELKVAIDLLAGAWKSYSSGDIDDVLVKCRKIIHELGKHVKEAGFQIKVEEMDKHGNKKMNKYPDWKKFFDSESKGDIVKSITEKLYGFVTPGAHEVSVLGINHAYFALHQTFSLMHFVISRFKGLEDD